MAWTHQIKPPLGWPLDRDEPINKGLVGMWLNQEKASVGGRLIDISDYGNHGTLIANAHSAPGKYGNALDFDGTDFVNCGDVHVPYTVTYIVWALLRETDQEAWIIGKDDEFEIGTRDDKIQYAFDDSGGDGWDFDNTGVDPPEIGTWHQWGFTYNGVKECIYLDGVEIYSEAASGTVTNDGNVLSIGAKSVGVAGLDCQVDHVIIYNRALSAGELALFKRFPFYGFMDPDKIPVLDQYYTVGVGNAGIMTTWGGYWGPTY